MIHARVLEVYVNFALMYTTDHIFLVLPIKYLINEDGNPKTPHKLAKVTKCNVFDRTNWRVITFTQFEEGNILTETRNNAESGDESDNESIMMREQDMENLDSNERSDHDLISTDMLEYIRDGSKTHLKVNKRKARYKIRDRIRQSQSEWKGALKST